MEKVAKITYRDGQADGRVIVRLNGKQFGYYAKPMHGSKADTYHLFYDQGRELLTFTSLHEMENFIRYYCL